MIYGEPGKDNSSSIVKFKNLAEAFAAEGFETQVVIYNDSIAEKLPAELIKFDAVLVWVNPLAQGDRKILDEMLTEVSSKGSFVSTHPEVILKIGTKDILYKTKDMDWGSDTKIYTSYDDFAARFDETLSAYGTRVLKQFRGNGGEGVFKVAGSSAKDKITVTHAKGEGKKTFTCQEFYKEFSSYFLNNGLLVDQQWNENIRNGMVRCYLSGTKVCGFGYQEINALYPFEINSEVKPVN